MECSLLGEPEPVSQWSAQRVDMQSEEMRVSASDTKCGEFNGLCCPLALLVFISW